MTEILKELGYTKQKCKTCGNEFWSIPERVTCGDAPCDEYEFIGNPATNKDYDLFEIQKVFHEFFEENGHTPIARYPVLAKRWRHDVFLVGASIYDFQPWVTSGLVEPPANPLVIVQPSIRLNDVDNVGRTGRHMTCFTMGAHHAFNRPDNEIYWKDKTIKLCHGFMTNIGIDSAEITFIESWWEGGGNAGPCYEVCVQGVELATLVFMQYKILPNGDREEIPLKTVDTGYGLERFAWISQGTPTAYDACFSPVINKLKKLTNINVDEKILAENAQIAGMMDIETFVDIRSLREKVANKLNISIEELLQFAEPMEAIYVIADHTRCLAFMLADRIIPSNIKEGYLVRLVLRRTIRFMKELDMKEPLSEIMEIQLDFLSKFYPEIKNSQEHIMNIINLEEERYAKTIDKGNRLVKRSIKNLKKQNKDAMPVETLIDLYDAHGMPPETVKEITEEIYNVNEFKVEIPDNFFTLVANQHSEEKITEDNNLELDYPSTDLLFYDDFYTSEFEAEILDIFEIKDSKNKKDSNFNINTINNTINNELIIVLNKTAFYPEGGGQPSDIGFLFIDNNEIEVTHVEKIKNIVLHKIKTDKTIDYFKKNKKIIKGKIDWNRRIALARNHTATHLIIASAKRVLGDHIWQTGAQKGLKRSKLDLSHYKRITQNEINQIEKIANELVMSNICVDIDWMSRDEAEKTYGFTLYQGGIVPRSQIRVINIPNIDVQACAGTHVLQTGEIGLIKINKTERIQDGVERIDFSAGSAAINFMQTNDEYLHESGDIFKVTPEQLPKTCKRFFTEWKSYKNEINKLKSEIADLKINSLDDINEINGLKVIKQIIDGDIKELQKIATDFTDNEKIDIAILGNNEGKIVGSASKLAINKNIKINEIIKESTTVFGGDGGGKPTLAQGAGPRSDKIKKIVDLAIDLIKLN